MMSRPEFSQQPSLLARNAFDKAAKTLRSTTKADIANIPPELRLRAVGLYLGGAASYFAGYIDDRFAQMGESVIEAAALDELGIAIPNREGGAIVALSERARPYFIPNPGDRARRGTLHVQLPWVELAQQNPLEALLLIIPALCEIEEAGERRFPDNPNGLSATIGERLAAFYRYAQQEKAGFTSPVVAEMIKNYRHAPEVPPQRESLTLEQLLDELNP